MAALAGGEAVAGRGSNGPRDKLPCFRRLRFIDERLRLPDDQTRWQKRWAEAGAFEVTEDPKRPKFYCLEMLPYPSGDITSATSATTASPT